MDSNRARYRIPCEQIPKILRIEEILVYISIITHLVLIVWLKKLNVSDFNVHN